MINLGLNRIKDLLRLANDPQKLLKVFHVAGTNGKGSVCTYIESILRRSGKTTGKFTSPHLVSPHDAVQINEAPINLTEYDRLRGHFERLSLLEKIGATEFEIQTAVAFRAFVDHQVDVAIVEVGLGGLEDATNVLEGKNVLCTTITKISVDHEGFLGHDLSSIARQKAGIVKPNIPCVLDGSNDKAVMDVVAQVCTNNNASLVTVTNEWGTYNGESPPPPAFWAQNQAVAIESVKQVYPDIGDEVIGLGIRSAVWPGRLQWLGPNLLVDGAHNVDAATELRSYVDSLKKPVRWILAFSKPADSLLDILVRPGDEVIATEFGPVDGMPWIQAQSMDTVFNYCKDIGGVSSVDKLDLSQLPGALKSTDKITIVAGSLYLVGQVLRIHNQAKPT